MIEHILRHDEELHHTIIELTTSYNKSDYKSIINALNDEYKIN